jgi:hypothetical protein
VVLAVDGHLILKIPMVNGMIIIVRLMQIFRLSAGLLIIDIYTM